METYIALLRGINVSGQKSVRMDELKLLMEQLGFDKVETYIQSGNVVFFAEKTDPGMLAERISKKISDKYGFLVPVIIRSENEIKTVPENNPFLKNNKTGLNKLYVTFLAESPDQKRIIALKEYDPTSNSFRIVGKEIYLCLPEGYGKTKWSNTFFENKLKVTASSRNWATVLQLVTMSANSSDPEFKN